MNQKFKFFLTFLCALFALSSTACEKFIRERDHVQALLKVETEQKKWHKTYNKQFRASTKPDSTSQYTFKVEVQTNSIKLEIIYHDPNRTMVFDAEVARDKGATPFMSRLDEASKDLTGADIALVQKWYEATQNFPGLPYLTKQQIEQEYSQ